MAEALYRKYRPSKLSDVYGQDIVVKTLIKSFENDKLGHAYLFSGPRGIGKTSLAKIIAKTVNCEKYPVAEACCECKMCKLNVNDVSDVIEIDAASNNGVDEIRELRNNVKFMPSVFKYKIYIIDEVHMLSTGAFNALLKTLEEPPAHVIFILATTELHKIPETIISRCQCFNLSKISMKAISDRLNEIVSVEKINLQAGVVDNIARLSNGGMRDAINMLEQLTSFSDNEIKLEDVFLLNGIVDPKGVSDLIKFVFESNILEINKKIEELKAGGKDIYKLSEELLLQVKDLLYLKLTNLGNEYFSSSYVNELDLEKIKFFLNKLNENINKIKFSLHSEVFLEVALLEVSMFDNNISTKVVNNLKEVENTDNKLLSNKIEKKEIKDSKMKDSKNILLEKKSVKKIFEEKCNYKIKDIEDFEEFKNNRVNNILSAASKKVLKETNKMLAKSEEYLVSKKHANLATIILDGNIRVASDWGIVISYKYDSMVDRFNCLLFEVEAFIKKIFDNDKKIIAISDEDWENKKADYIKTKNKSEVYFFVDEDFDIDDLFVVNKKVDASPLIEETIGKVDEDLIEIE